MKKNRIFLVMIIILLAAGLAACERSAATPMPGSGEEPTADPTEVANVLIQSATQTAMAKAESEGETTISGEEEATEAPKPTATPEPETEEAEEEPEPEEEEEESEPAAEKEYPIPDQYTLKAGEFPYCIARRFDIAPSALLSANNLNRSSVVYPGTTLTIPKNAAAFNEGARSLRQHPTSYTVRGGDTIYSIACRFGDVFPEAIADANDLKGAYTLNVGQAIQIP